MKNHSDYSTIAQLSAAVLLVASATLTSACSSEVQAEEPNLFAEQVQGLAGRLQTLEDVTAIKEVMDCYGYGHDMIFFDLQGDRAEALSILRNCFTEDVQTDVFFFGGAEPMAQLKSLEELVGFVANFAINSGYTGARNVPGNRQIEITGPETARMLSSTSAPHFIALPADAAAPVQVDFVSARYVNDLVLSEDGRWRTARFQLLIDGFWRGDGSFPLGGANQ